MGTIKGGKVCIKVNENYGPYFPTHKGLRQGDSLSPLMFNLVADALAILMDNARKMGLIKGLLAENIEGGLICYNTQMAPFFCCKMIMKVPAT